MKFETKLNKILSLENEKLKQIKLINFAMSLFPNSAQQKQVINLLK